MPKKDESGESMISETGNWNYAEGYIKKKIGLPLERCDDYQDIAMFGTESIIEELANFSSPPNNDYVRFTGLKRLISELIKIIDNAKFALKKPGTRKKALRYRKWLSKLQTQLNNLINVVNDEVDDIASFSIISYKSFNTFVEGVVRIKSKLNEPLNTNHLIFTDKEEFDPLAFKKKKKHQLTQRG